MHALGTLLHRPTGAPIRPVSTLPNPSTHRPRLQACAGGTEAFRSRAATTYTAIELTLADRPPATPAAMLFPDSRGSTEAESTIHEQNKR